MGLSMWHLVILAVVVLVLFGGRGKISDLMGDFAKGITSFRKGLKEGDGDDDKPAPQPLPRETNKDTVGR